MNAGLALPGRMDGRVGTSSAAAVCNCFLRCMFLWRTLPDIVTGQGWGDNSRCSGGLRRRLS